MHLWVRSMCSPAWPHEREHCVVCPQRSHFTDAVQGCGRIAWAPACPQFPMAQGSFFLHTLHSTFVLHRCAATVWAPACPQRGFVHLLLEPHTAQTATALHA